MIMIISISIDVNAHKNDYEVFYNSISTIYSRLQKDVFAHALNHI